MDDGRRALLAEPHADGLAHDAAQQDRLLRRRNLEPDTADLLALVVRMVRARLVVEIGTSNGYSTIWLADAVADTGGQVISVDTAATDEASESLNRANRGGVGDHLAGIACLRSAGKRGQRSIRTHPRIVRRFTSVGTERSRP